MRCSEEVTAYIFDGLVAEWQLNAGDLGVFAAAFPAGCVVGSLASAVLLDRYGRRHAMMAGSCAAALTGG